MSCSELATWHSPPPPLKSSGVAQAGGTPGSQWDPKGHFKVSQVLFREIHSCYMLAIEEPVLKRKRTGTSLVVQWLRLCTFTAGGMGSIPGWGTKILHAATKIPCAATKTQPSQINKY